MKASICLLLSFGFLLASFSPITGQEPNENDVPKEEIILNDDNIIDDEEKVILNDDNNDEEEIILMDENDEDNNEDYDNDNANDDDTDDNEKTLDVRQYYIPPYSVEDSYEIDKRWVYICKENECNDRCKILLKQPSGKCSSNGKCYCTRRRG